MATKKKTVKTFFDYYPDFPRDKSHLVQLCLPREKMNNKKTPWPFPVRLDTENERNLSIS